MPRKVERTRNGNTWTEAMLMGRIRSALRNIWRFYKPRAAAKKLSEKKVIGKRHKLEYQCSDCEKWFRSNQVEVNHKIPAGSLKSFKDLPMFCERLFCEEPEGYDVKCKPCHKLETQKQRKKQAPRK